MDKIEREVAENEFQRFADAMFLRLDDDDEFDFDDEGKKNSVEHRRILIKNIQSGALIINDNGEPVFTPQASPNHKPLTFREPDGVAVAAGARRKPNDEMGKLFATCGEMTKTHPSTFAKMKWRDIMVCASIVGLFLG